MNSEESSLELLKSQMSKEQISDMAEIVSNEIKRRESMNTYNRSHGAKAADKSNVRSSRIGNSLGAEDLRDVYAEVNQKVQQKKVQDLEARLGKVKNERLKNERLQNQQSPARRAAFSERLSLWNLALVLGVVALAGAKIFLSDGSAKPQTASLSTEEQAAESFSLPKDSVGKRTAELSGARASLSNSAPGVWSPAEVKLLTELDSRRVELDNRESQLDQKESELKIQTQALAERTAELKSLSNKISQVRKEKDSQYEARMEQLATVYGTMAPNEAAPLVEKLDESTALALLKRMPNKRMAQILSAMPAERAVALTKTLSEKSNLEEIPAR